MKNWRNLELDTKGPTGTYKGDGEPREMYCVCTEAFVNKKIWRPGNMEDRR